MAAQRLFLIGPRGCGKSSVGGLAAESLGLLLHDTDLMVEAACGRSIASLVKDSGWEAFRLLESEALERAASLGGVVATGGGAVLSARNRELMRADGLVIYLSVPVKTLYARLSGNPDSARRPSLTGADPLREIAGILEEREALYRETAHHVLEADSPPERVADAVARLARAAAPATRSGGAYSNETGPCAGKRRV